MTADYHRLSLVFVDGVGLAAATAANPLAELPSPCLARLLGGPLTLEQCQQKEELLLTGIDANLGVDGLPQSATGQAALFTGINAAESLGRHVTGLPGPRVRAIVESDNLFVRVGENGFRSTFANAYSQTYLDSLSTGARRPSVTTCAVSAAGLPLRGLADLERNRAVSWDILRDRFLENVDSEAPVVTALEAGRHLAMIGRHYHLTVYETFITDMAGHGRLGFSVADAVSRLDGLIGGVLEARSRNTTLLVTSDHGNLEESGHRRHTRNSVPLLAVGPLAGRFADVTSILGVAPRIMDCLDEPSSPE